MWINFNFNKSGTFAFTGTTITSDIAYFAITNERKVVQLTVCILRNNLALDWGSVIPASYMVHSSVQK